jgi:hypothetical protein
MKTLELTIYRHTPNIKVDRNNIGDLFIEDEFFCHTLEDEIRPDGVKVYGKTAIKAGRYKVILTRSYRFKRIMPLIVDVPMFTGIRLHGGNSSIDTSGCPLVAFNTDYKKIWGTAEKALTKRLQEHDGDIYITIKNAFLSYDRDLKKETI